MPPKQPSPLTRILPRSELLRMREAPLAILFAIGAMLALGGLLFVFYLLVSLVISGGRLAVTVPIEQGREFSLLTGVSLPVDLDASAETVRIERGNAGLADTVWRSRGTIIAAVMRPFMDRTLLFRDTWPALLSLTAAGVLLSVIYVLMLTSARRICGTVGQDVAVRLRRAIHRQTLRLAPGDLRGDEVAMAKSLFITGTDRVENGIAGWLTSLYRDVPHLCLLLLAVFLINWRMAILCIVPVFACRWLWTQARNSARRQQQLAADRADRELSLLGESLSKARLVRGYGMENHELEQFQSLLDRYRHTLWIAKLNRESRTWALFGTGFIILLVAGFLIYLLAAKVIVNPNEMSPAAATIFISSLLSMVQPLRQLSRARPKREDASVAAGLIYRYLDRIPPVGQAVGAKFLQPLSRAIEFHDLHVLFDNRPLLDGINLKLPAGKVIAIVSPEPLEAAAMASLLPRFIEPSRGRVLFDGEDIAWATLESLRAETVYIGGEDPFFTGTIFENIIGGLTNYSSQQAVEAAKLARAHNFIVKLPQGYETVIGEHGEQLDAGQGFRLGLARAVLRNPALMIIEEPAGTLDESTKSLLEDAYTRTFADRTVVLLPSRLSTLRRADLVVLLQDGKVQAVGPHAELVKENALYRHWEYLHFNQFRRFSDGRK